MAPRRNLGDHPDGARGSPPRSMESMTKEQSITTRRTTRRRGRRLAAACAALALGTLAAAVPASASVPPAHARTPILPAPTGRYQVGESALHLVDRTRTDPWHSGG